jgi:hypothetical protein
MIAASGTHPASPGRFGARHRTPGGLRALPVAMAVLVLAVYGWAGPSGEAGGHLDWQAKILHARGIAPPSAVGGRAGQLRAARADALQNLLAALGSRTLSAETTVGAFLGLHEDLRQEVHGVCRGFREPADPVFRSDGSVELAVELPLGSEFRRALLGDQAWREGQVQPVQYSDLDPARSVFTGLIIDGRSQGLLPAFAPRVLSAAGHEVYGSGWADRERALQAGLVAYAADLDQAQAMIERIGSKPLIIEAVGLQGSLRCDPLIPEREGKLLHGLAENLRVLAECRVVFVVD